MYPLILSFNPPQVTARGSTHPTEPITRYIACVRELLRRNRRFFTVALIAGAALRLLFIFRFPGVTIDSFIYGDIAKNWLQHGIYGITESAGVVLPTFIRLPGYPAFLAASFTVFGMEHYRAVLIVQMLVDLTTCLIIADIALRLAGDRVAKSALVLAALCPFLAMYSAAALTETLEVFFTALTLACARAALATRRTYLWLFAGMATAAAILLRPDGGLLLCAIGFYLLCLTLRASLKHRPQDALQLLRPALLYGLISLTPLVPWTLRNLHTMHRFQPLAPRYANEQNEFVPAGFNRWVKTWIADYVSVEEIYWPVPGETVDVAKLPDRAFDSPEQRRETEQLLAEYNDQLHISPELDGRFAELGGQRISSRPLRYYLFLPALRIADMWLRPRTETLPSDSRWWEFNDDPKWSTLAVGMGVVGLFYVLSALYGLPRALLAANMWLFLGFVLLRSAFLGTLENPEPRYTLECYPIVIVLAAIGLSSLCSRSR
jgi:4-amino-4-deoxy-L-arabinose transferase-like glycosyltransferase